MPAPAPRIDIAVSGGNWPPRATLRRLTLRAVKAALAEGSRVVNDAEVSVLFTDDDHMRRLNGEWRGVDRPTNVLAFPSGAKPGAPAGLPLGDIVLAEETIRREAGKGALEFEHHLAHLIVHGLLHLLGYDHDREESATDMEAREVAALRRLGIADPYADHASA
ncbi:MAG: rRNA maturation RNase YbeY [Bauldia sp.]